MTDLPAPAPQPTASVANFAAPSTESVSSSVEHEIFETEASRLATVPIWLLALSGTLRLTDQRLSFRTRSKTVFDAPLSEFHSVAENAFGMVLWHGDKQHRFTFGRPASVRLYSNNLALIASALPKTFDNARTARGDTASWLYRLVPLVGFAPPGLVVPKPWPKWKTWLAIGGVIVGLLAVTVGLAALDHALT